MSSGYFPADDPDGMPSDYNSTLPRGQCEKWCAFLPDQNQLEPVHTILADPGTNCTTYDSDSSGYLSCALQCKEEYTLSDESQAANDDGDNPLKVTCCNGVWCGLEDIASKCIQIDSTTNTDTKSLRAKLTSRSLVLFGVLGVMAILGGGFSAIYFGKRSRYRFAALLLSVLTWLGAFLSMLDLALATVAGRDYAIAIGFMLIVVLFVNFYLVKFFISKYRAEDETANQWFQSGVAGQHRFVAIFLWVCCLINIGNFRVLHELQRYPFGTAPPLSPGLKTQVNRAHMVMIILQDVYLIIVQSMVLTTTAKSESLFLYSCLVSLILSGIYMCHFAVVFLVGYFVDRENMFYLGEFNKNSTSVKNTLMVGLLGSGDGGLAETDVFLSHAWTEKDEMGRGTHQRVEQVNSLLKAQGITTWFDGERMDGHMVDKMSNGIEMTKIFIVFIDKNYMDKVANPQRLDDNVKREFDFAVSKKTPSKMIPVIMEPRMRDTRTWVGGVGFNLASHLYVDMSGDDLGASTANLVTRIHTMLGNNTSTPAPNAPPPAAVLQP